MSVTWLLMAPIRCPYHKRLQLLCWVVVYNCARPRVGPSVYVIAQNENEQISLVAEAP